MILPSFQAKTGWKSPRKSENKNYRSDQFLYDLLQGIPKKLQKNSKNSITPVCLLFQPKLVGKDWERVKIKIIVPISSYPAHYKEFQNKSKKIQKIKNMIFASFHAKKGQESPRKSDNKNYRSDQFIPDPL